MSLPSFTAPVPDNGYRWWYVDAVSDDGVHALTVIVFIGSVFSPYYARARMRQPRTAALQHCSVNMALYGPVSRWCMTERSEPSVHARDDSLSIGKSGMRVTPDGQLQIDVNEVTVPLPGKLEGTLTLTLPAYDIPAVPLDTLDSTTAQHFWQPVAPQTRIEVRMEKPQLSWNGAAYIDSNYGDIPLENSFKSWIWSRSHAPANETVVHYDIVAADGTVAQRSMHFDASGVLQPVTASQHHQLSTTRYWRIPRSARTPEGVTLSDVQTLEDTPFYSRSRFLEHYPEHTQTSVHESLDLERFNSAWVRCLLPFRMPRSTRPVQ